MWVKAGMALIKLFRKCWPVTAALGPVKHCALTKFVIKLRTFFIQKWGLGD